MGPPAGFTAENTGGLGRLLVNPEPGTKKLYACRVKINGDPMTSPWPDCEKQDKLGELGYVFDRKPADVPAMPLYRCIYEEAHFDSLDPKCEGYQTEWSYGWVVTG